MEDNVLLFSGGLDSTVLLADQIERRNRVLAVSFDYGQTHRRELIAAKRIGKWVHMGRVNSGKRYRYAEAIGCDSVDGSYLRFGPDTNLPKLLSWVRSSQPSLF